MKQERVKTENLRSTDCGMRIARIPLLAGGEAEFRQEKKTLGHGVRKTPDYPENDDPIEA